MTLRSPQKSPSSPNARDAATGTVSGWSAPASAPRRRDGETSRNASCESATGAPHRDNPGTMGLRQILLCEQEIGAARQPATGTPRRRGQGAAGAPGDQPGRGPGTAAGNRPAPPRTSSSRDGLPAGARSARRRAGQRPAGPPGHRTATRRRARRGAGRWHCRSASRARASRIRPGHRRPRLPPMRSRRAPVSAGTGR